MLIARSEDLDIYRNLALEECLLDLATERGPILFLWRSAGAVVLGKNQNPWHEINLPVLRAEGLALARRGSGGGTVFHDAGNLNYALALPRDTYDQDETFERLIRVFHQADIPAARGPHHGLVVHGRKFSGSAFWFRRQTVLHHGTLLINADLERMTRVLTGGLSLTTHAIPSHPMPVINLAVAKEGFDMALAEQLVIHAFADSAQELAPDELDALPWREKAARHRSWDWQFGQTPPFDCMMDGIAIHVEHGRVVTPLPSNLSPMQRAHLAELFGAP